jgi:hypothetical protein
MRATSVGPDLSRAIVRIEKRVGPPGRLPKLAVLILLWNCRSQRWLCWLMEPVVETAADPLRTHRTGSELEPDRPSRRLNS